MRHLPIWTVVLLLFAACEEASVPRLPMPEFTGFTAEVTFETAVITVSHLGDYGIVDAGIYLGEDRRIKADQRESGRYSVSLSGLEESMTYSYKAFISNGSQETISEVQTFTTAPAPKIIQSGEGIYTIVTENTSLQEILDRFGVAPEDITHLTLVGRLTDDDFPIIRKQMRHLESLNLEKTDVTVLPYVALANCEFTALVLPETLIEIGKCAVTDCRLLSGAITLPKGLKILGIDSFSNCYLLESVEFPDELEAIKSFSFLNCGRLGGELRLPETLTEIGERAFEGTAFHGSLAIPRNVKYIPAAVFMNAGFNGELTLHDAITEIGDTAFAENSFTGSLNLPASLKYLGVGAFAGNCFTGDIVIPTRIVDIPMDVFSDGLNRQQYSRVILHKDVKAIRSRAFFEEDNVLQEVICHSKEPPLYEEDAFNPAVVPLVSLYVPADAIQRYREADGWKDFGSIKPIE